MRPFVIAAAALALTAPIADADTDPLKQMVVPVASTCEQAPAKQYNSALKRVYSTHKHLDSLRGTSLAKRPRFTATPQCASLLTKQQNKLQRLRKLVRKWAKRNCSGGTPTQNKCLGKRLAARRGWIGQQWSCLLTLWTRESGWRTSADNPTSSAHGIPQALPGSKMGPGWRRNPRVQVSWGLGYVRGRYGSPCSALSFWNNYHWY